MKRLLLIPTFLLMLTFAQAQNVGINTTGAAPDAGAGLDVSFTNKGLLVPRVSIANLNTIAPITGSTTESLLVYNTNAGTGAGFYYWNGAQWVRLSTAGDAWSLTGNAGTNTATNFLGTTDAQALVLRTNNAERMRILAGGQVVINNITPFAGTVLSSYAFGTDAGIVTQSANGTALTAQTTGTGTGAVIFKDGASGRAMEIVTNNAGNADLSLGVFQNGTGRAGNFQNNATTNVTQTLFAAHNGTSTNANAAAVWGQSDGIAGGVFLATRVNANTVGLTGQYIGGGNVDAVGVEGISVANAGWGIGVFGQGNWYGVASFGDFTATGVKAFTIDHPTDPENKFLKHFAIESDEVLNHYRGNVTLDGSGTATVQLPDYFDDININFSYTLTPVGAAMPNLHISQEISGNEFKISGGQPGMKVSWVVQAERNDKYMQTHPDSKVVEPAKKSYMQGKYIDTESWGQPKENSIFGNRERSKVNQEEPESEEISPDQDGTEVNNE